MNRNDRLTHLAAAAMATCGVTGLCLGTPATWLGAALLYGAFSLLRNVHGQRWGSALKALQTPRNSRWGDRDPGSLLLEGTYLTLIVVLAITMLVDVFAGERPVSHDHTVHYFKALQMHRDFLPQGRLLGWSQRMFAGYPANYLYPIGADLWVNLCHALGLGWLSFSQAYGVAFMAFFALFGIAGYRFGRMLGGPHVGLITALLLLTDLSDFRLGGWIYTVDFGVWPQALSLAFALLGLCHLPAIFEGKRITDLAAFGLWIGLSAITHPMILIFLALLWPIAGIASAFSNTGHVLLGLTRLSVAYVLGALSASLWLLPFFSTKSFTNAMGVFWDTTYEMGKGLVSLTTLTGTLGYVLAFGLPALFVCARSRSFRLLFAAVVAVAVPMVTSSTWVDELHLTALSPAFAKVQYLRMATMVKPFWFALAAQFVVAIASALPALRRRFEAHLPTPQGQPRTRVRSTVFATLFAFVTLPLIAAAGQAFYVDHVRKSLRTVVDREYLSDRTALQQYLAQHLPREGFYRLGIFMGHNHDLFDMAAELDVPIYKRGFTPCANFVYKMQSEDRAVLDAVKLRFAISKNPLPQADFELVRRFGIYGLYSYKHYLRAPYSIIDGQGEVRVTRFEDERIELNVAEGAEGTLQLPVSYFPRWHAYRDGQELSITERRLAAEPDKTGFISVPLSAGHYVFRFERTLVDRIALPISLATALLCVAMIGVERRRRRPILSEIQDWIETWTSHLLARSGLALLVGLGASTAVGFIALGQMRPALKPDPYTGFPPIKRVLYDFVENLGEAQAHIRYRDRPRECRRVLGELMCPTDRGEFSSDRYVGSQPTTIEEYRMVRCIRARPDTSAILSVDFDDVPRGQALVGYYGLDYEGRLLYYKRPVHLRVSIDRQPVHEADTERDNHMHWFIAKVPPGEDRAHVRFEISANNPYKRWFCFQAQMVDLGVEERL